MVKSVNGSGKVWKTRGIFSFTPWPPCLYDEIDEVCSSLQLITIKRSLFSMPTLCHQSVNHRFFQKIDLKNVYSYL